MYFKDKIKKMKNIQSIIKNINKFLKDLLK
jgi:hypothetical protein